MNYTLSDSFSTDAGTGHRLHDDDKAIPTVVSSEDMNMLIWSLMEIVNAAGITPALFDPAVPATYSKLLAALRSGGLFCPVLQLNSTQVLPSSAFGATVQAYGSGPFTLTLPSAATPLPRTKIEFGNYCGSGIVTIASGSANMSWNGVAASVSSFTLGLGDTATLIWTGSSWLVISGSAQLRYSAAFASSLTASGWKRYPDPNSPTGYFIEQWGSSGSIPQGGSLGITFPIAFPNACIGVYPTTYGQTSGTTLPFSVGSASYAPNGATLWNNGANGVIIASWCAKGY